MHIKIVFDVQAYFFQNSAKHKERMFVDKWLSFVALVGLHQDQATKVSNLVLLLHRLSALSHLTQFN